MSVSESLGYFWLLGGSEISIAFLLAKVVVSDSFLALLSGRSQNKVIEKSLARGLLLGWLRLLLLLIVSECILAVLVLIAEVESDDGVGIGAGKRGTDLLLVRIHKYN